MDATARRQTDGINAHYAGQDRLAWTAAEVEAEDEIHAEELRRVARDAARRAERATLREAIEYAPSSPGRVAPGLLGWWTKSGLFLCSSCAGRIMARGCSIPAGSTSVWTGGAAGECVTCAEAAV